VRQIYDINEIVGKTIKAIRPSKSGLEIAIYFEEDENYCLLSMAPFLTKRRQHKKGLIRDNWFKSFVAYWSRPFDKPLHIPKGLNALPSHPLYKCVPACVAPHGIVDRTRPIPGVWMCGTQSEFDYCAGFKPSYDEGNGYICKYFQRKCGGCILAGRPTTVKELRGESDD
jgi:hypothetical protein